MPTNDDNARLAVLIDADNTSGSLVKAMLDELAGYGTVTVKRAYGDWTNQHLSKWRSVLLANAISPQQQFAYTVGKNATDSALIIDAMDLLYSGNVDGFAIVSSDSDFTPLATRLREAGKQVIGVGRRKTPKAFVEACDKFIFLEVLGAAGDGDPAEPEPEPTTPAQPAPIQSVLTKALNRIDTDDDRWASLSALGNYLNRTDPSFDPRSYDFPKLSELVKAQPYVETQTGGGQLRVRLKGRQSAPAAKKAAAKPAKSAKSAKSPKSAKKAAAEGS
jgi:uncharacterized protein (TIGR00288 family)